jgi:type I restriction enzyme, S subunit
MENGKVAVAKNLHGGMACGSTEFHVLRASPHVLPEYIWSFLRRRSYREAAAQHMTGAVGQRRVPEEFIKQSVIPLPPICEQRRIVAKMEGLSDHSMRARDKLARVPGLVERYKQAVLAAAFRGDLTARWRMKNPNAVGSQDFLALRARVAANQRNGANLGRDERSAVKDRDEELSTALRAVAEDRGIPATWTWCGVGEAFGVYVGATPSRKELTHWGGNIPWISSGEVAFCRIRDTRESLSATGLRSASTRLHPPGTVLPSMIGEGKTRGQAAVLDISACNNQNCAAIRVSEAAYCPEYVYWYFYAVYEETRTAGAGNNQPALNKDRVQRLPIPLAPPAEAVEVARAIENYLEPIGRLESELSSAEKPLDNLDDRVSAKAFCGKLFSVMEPLED